jgi:uncharacterized protein (TIGR02246 family)
MRPLRWICAVILLSACAGGETKSGGESSAAPPPAAADPTAVRAAIDAANKQGLESFNAGKPDGMIANYAADAVVMMPGMKAMKGKAEIEAGMKGMFSAMDMKNFNAVTTDVMVGGDMAVETGTMTYDSGPKGGKLVTDTVKYVTVWKKQADGSWKIVRDINNTDIAPKM